MQSDAREFVIHLFAQRPTYCSITSSDFIFVRVILDDQRSSPYRPVFSWSLKPLWGRRFFRADRKQSILFPFRRMWVYDCFSFQAHVDI